jgi:hypothetical protein
MTLGCGPHSDPFLCHCFHGGGFLPQYARGERFLDCQASTIAETSLQDLKRLRPVFPDGATLYFVDRSSLGSLRWYYDYGSLIRLFYPAKSLDIQFIDRGYALPDRRTMPKGSFIFEYDGSHLSEIPVDSN